MVTKASLRPPSNFEGPNTVFTKHHTPHFQLLNPSFLPSLKLFEPADEHEPCLRFHFGDMQIMRQLDGDNNAEGGESSSSIHQRKEDSDRGKRCISQFCKSSSSTSARWDGYSHVLLLCLAFLISLIFYCYCKCGGVGYFLWLVWISFHFVPMP